jgi:peptidoglycan/LPS O-acetylase OafA/YrhL
VGEVARNTFSLPMKHEQKFEWFDLFRGCAAMLVLLGHVRALMFLPYAESKPNGLGKVFFFMTGFGHEAVVIFFVLSGFFIIRSIHKSAVSGKWSASNYALNRLSRLWTVLIPALIISFVWDSIGMEFYSTAPSYRGEIPFMDVSPVGKLSLSVLLGNIFFVQSIVVPTFGSNGALWSLTNEFWYYALFPLLYFSLVRQYNALTRIALVMIAVAVTLFVGYSIALYFLVWLMGGAVYLVVEKNKKWTTTNLLLIASLVLVLGTLGGIRIGLNPSVFNDFTLGVAVSTALIALSGRTIKSEWLRKISIWLSNISYTVYVVHLPLAVLITTVLIPLRLTWSLQSLGMYFLVCIILVVYAVAMYYVFERNTTRIKKFISQLSTRYSHA